jgi:hypothetical protein
MAALQRTLILIQTTHWTGPRRCSRLTPGTTGDQPAPETHFCHHGKRAILNKGGEACFASVVGFPHRELRGGSMSCG